MTKSATFAAILVCAVATARAQEFDFDALWEQGVEAANTVMDPLGFEVDRAAVPRLDDALRFWRSVEQRLRTGNVMELAALRPAVETALDYLDHYPAAEPYIGRLRQELDYLVLAEEAVREESPLTPVRPAPPAPSPFVLPAPPAAPPPPAVRARVQARAREPARWEQRLKGRPAPARADQLVPVLKRIFREEGVPEALVWLAEVESSMNPAARSPVGAAGLFQFMPATARHFGLRTERPDERLAPERSARAAAQYLRLLHGRFQNWELALAAYNAGEGRVGRLLRAARRKDFEGIADDLPMETQLYVPKIAAVIKLREGLSLAALPPPRV